MSQSRLFELVYHLLEHGQTSAAALAEKFEVSVRTIYRDVEALSAAGVPVYTLPGRSGGVALMEQYVLNKATFSDREQGQLLTALRSLAGNRLLGDEETLSKLSALFRRSEPDWLQVDLSHWGDGTEANTKFQKLKEAILGRKVISFTYVSSYGGRTAREVLPARLVFKGQTWYLQGFCLEKQDYRTFRLSRMLELEVTERTFSTPLSPPPSRTPGEIPPSSPCVSASPPPWPTASMTSLRRGRSWPCPTAPSRSWPPTRRTAGSMASSSPSAERWRSSPRGGSGSGWVSWPGKFLRNAKTLTYDVMVSLLSWAYLPKRRSK